MIDRSRGPWVHCPDDIGDLVDALSTQSTALTAAWAGMARRLGAPAGSTAPVSYDERALFESHPDAPAGIVQAAGRSGAQYVDAAGQHVQAIGALLDARQVTLSIWPIVRAELETAGRVAWLLEPNTETTTVSVSQRVARVMMEGLASACRSRYTAKRMRGMGQRERDLKQARDRIRDDLVHLFPTARTEWTEPGQEQEWLVDGESYLALGAGAELFCRRWLGDARGL